MLSAADDTVVSHIGEGGVINALESVEAHGALLACARTGNDGTAKDHGDVAGAIVGGVEQALIEIELGIGKGVFHRLLGAGEHNGLRAFLNEVGERRRGVCHGVGAVKDNEAVVAVVGFADGARDAQPIARAHVGTVDIHELSDFDLRHLGNLGHCLGKLFSRDGGGEPVSVF